jgi:ABC-type iron transport system FetAB ATPase subunit
MDETRAAEITDVTVRFGGRTVLEGFSLSLRPGAKALLNGPSGCGKSTVLRCLLGFVTPEAGSVHIEGQPLTAETVWRLRRRLAYVGQEPDLGVGTASVILERPFHYRANAGLRANLERVPALFRQFGLDLDLLEKEMGDLSGGEKQRVALIGALLLDRPIFLLDEVTSALDPASRDAVVDYFRSRDDITALFVAHDADVFSFVDQVISMQQNNPSRGAA